jgi:hypothetical protein
MKNLANEAAYKILLALIAIIGHNMTINGGVIYVY